jgi:hypothetical protein
MSAVHGGAPGKKGLLMDRSWCRHPTAIFVCCVGILLASRTNYARQAISTAPPRIVPSEPRLDDTDSSLTLSLRLPFPRIVQAASRLIPAEIPLSGNGSVGCVGVPYLIGPRIEMRQICKDVPYCDFRGCGTQKQCADVPTPVGPSIGSNNQCADYNWRATLAASAPLSLSRAGDALRVEQSIVVRGQAGVGGDLAKALSLTAKNFEAKARPGFDVRLSMDERWCPTAKVSPTMDWVSAASVEVVGRNCLSFDLGPLGRPEVCAGPANVDLTSAVNSGLSGARQELATSLAAGLTCDATRGPASRFWRTLSVPLQISDSERAFLNVTPQSAAFSGVIVDDGAVRLSLRVRAKTQIGPTAIATRPLDLPRLESSAEIGSGLDVNARITIPYEQLARMLGQAVAGRTFQHQTPLGTADVRIQEATVFPTTEGLAVGLRINADMPRQFFNTKGWVYLSGRPVVDPSGRAVTIAGLRYSLVLDSTFWSLTSTLFEGSVLALLRSHSTFDLVSLERRLASAVTNGLDRAQFEGLKLKAASPQVSLRSVVPGPQGLIVLARLLMPFEVEVVNH